MNQKRQELQRSTLQLVVVPLVFDRAGRLEQVLYSKFPWFHVSCEVGGVCIEVGMTCFVFVF